MITNKLRSAVYALTMGGAAIATAACNTEGGLEQLSIDAGRIAQYAAASDAASSVESGAKPEDAASSTAQAADTEYPTHAEARHFAVYNRYRATVESSGSSGSGSQTGCGDGQQIFIPGGRLFGIEQSVCPDGIPQK